MKSRSRININKMELSINTITGNINFTEIAYCLDSSFMKDLDFMFFKEPDPEHHINVSYCYKYRLQFEFVDI